MFTNGTGVNSKVSSQQGGSQQESVLFIIKHKVRVLF